MKSKVKKKNAEEQMTRKKIVVNLGGFFYRIGTQIASLSPTIFRKHKQWPSK